MEPEELPKIDDGYDTAEDESEQEGEQEEEERAIAREFAQNEANATELKKVIKQLKKVAKDIDQNLNVRLVEADLDTGPVNQGGLIEQIDDNDLINGADPIRHDVGQVKRTRTEWVKKHFLTVLGLTFTATIGFPGLILGALSFAGRDEAKKQNAATPPPPNPPQKPTFDLMDEKDLKALGFTDEQLKHIKEFVAIWRKMREDDFWKELITYVTTFKPSIQAQYVIMRYVQSIYGEVEWEAPKGEAKTVTTLLYKAYVDSAKTSGPNGGPGKASTVALYRAMAAYKTDDDKVPPRNIAALYCQLALAKIYKDLTLARNSNQLLMAAPEPAPVTSAYYLSLVSVAEGVDPFVYDATSTGISTTCDDDFPFASPCFEDHEARLAALPLERRTVLGEKTVIVKRALRQRFGWLESEALVMDSLEVLAEGLGPAPAGTLCYRRETDKAVQVFALPHITFSPDTGALDVVPAKAAIYTRPSETTVLSSTPVKTVRTIVDTSAQIATFVGMTPALLPEGLILSGAAIVVQQVFDALCGRNEQPRMDEQKLLSDFKNVLLDLNIDASKSVILTDYDWLRDNYDAAWQKADALGGTDKIKSDKDAYLSPSQMKDFKRHLSDKLADDKGIIDNVKLMQMSNYQVKGFPVFMLGANCVLWLMKIDLILQSANTTGLNAKSMTTLINHVNDYHAYGVKTMALIDSMILTRTNSISPPYPSKTCQTISGGGSTGVSKVCNDNWSFMDTWSNFPDDNPKQSKVTSIDCSEVKSGCNYNEVSSRPQLVAERTKYIADKKTEAELHYYLGKRDQYEQQLKDWKGLSDKLTPLLGI